MTAVTIDASALGFGGRLAARSARPTHAPCRQADVILFRVRTAPAAGRQAAAARAATPLRLTRRGRLLITLLVVVLGLGVALAGARTAGAGSTAEPVGVQEITVHPGDTLWSLASESAAGGDVRDRVAEIRELNGLRTSDLRAGQALLVPVG